MGLAIALQCHATFGPQRLSRASEVRLVGRHRGREPSSCVLGQGDVDVEGEVGVAEAEGGHLRPGVTDHLGVRGARAALHGRQRSGWGLHTPLTRA